MLQGLIVCGRITGSECFSFNETTNLKFLQEITYGFTAPFPYTDEETRRQNKVRITVGEWQKYANIHFRYLDDPKLSTIRISFVKKDGSWSHIGTEANEVEFLQPTMNLGWLSGLTDTVSDTERGVILHEFGHVLGLLHEHQSPLRGDKIHLKESGTFVLLFLMIKKLI